jgi:hypothetical protein
MTMQIQLWVFQLSTIDQQILLQTIDARLKERMADGYRDRLQRIREKVKNAEPAPENVLVRQTPTNPDNSLDTLSE